MTPYTSSYTSPLSTPGAASLMQARHAATNELLSPATANNQAKNQAKNEAKAKATAQDFEAVFLNQMFQHMFSGLEGEGPFGGGPGIGVWRSFLTDEYAKSFAKNGGIGIGDQVYRELLARQSAQAVTTARIMPSNPYAATAGAKP